MEAWRYRGQGGDKLWSLRFGNIEVRADKLWSLYGRLEI